MSSNAKPIVSTSDYSPSTDMFYTKPKANANGGKSVGILNKNSMKSTYLSTPLMLTWGTNENDFENTGNVKYDLAIQFPNPDFATEQTDTFLKAMVDFETKIKADAIVNCKDWFGKPKMSPEVIEALFSPMLKYRKDKETGEFDMTSAPTLRVKIPCWDGEFKTEIYDLQGKPLYPNTTGDTPVNLIPKGVNMAAVIQSGGIWFANGKFGVTWKLFQAVIKPKTSLKGVCHIQLSAEDATKLNSQSAELEEEEEIGCTVEESDEEEIEESEEEAEEVAAPVVVVQDVVPVAVPVVKKKVVRRKKETAAAAAA